MFLRTSSAAAVVPLAIASAALAQPACLDIQIVPQTGSLPGTIVSGTPGSTIAILRTDTGTSRTRRFEVQMRIRDNNLSDGITVDSLASMQFNIAAAVSGTVPGSTVSFAPLSAAESAGTEYGSSTGCQPPTSDSSGAGSGAGLHTPWNGGLPPPGTGGGTISGLNINGIQPLTLSRANADPVSCAPNTRWMPIYSFQFTAPNTTAEGTVTFTATPVADAPTGNTFGFYSNESVPPISSGCSGRASITVQVNPVIAPPAPAQSADSNLDGVVSVQDIFNFLSLWFAGV